MAGPVRFQLNGAPAIEAQARPTTTLLQWLRSQRLTGTKEGCAEGDCGACTVAILDPDAGEGTEGRWRAVNSCLVLLPMVHGRQVVTVEGLADGSTLHPAQAAMVRTLGSQCGYCTPGFVMSLFEACYRPDLDAPWKRDDQLCGNLCRCTGYRPIRDALHTVAGSRPQDAFLAALRTPTATKAAAYATHDQHLDAPTELSEAIALLQHPGARVVAGATDLGLEITQRHQHPERLVSLERVRDLRGMRIEEQTVLLGAATPLADIEAWSAGPLPVMHRMLRYFGSRQIKHRATLGGNLCNASPIGDLAPVLLALDASVVVAGPSGTRTIPIEDFFVAYRKTALQPAEILIEVQIPLPDPQARRGAYKVSRRRELDISAVSAAMRVELDASGCVRLARLAYGGMAATPARAHATEAALLGQPWTAQTVQAVAVHLDHDFTPMSDHRGSAWFRSTVARNLLVGFEVETRDHPVVALPERHTGTVVPQEGP